MSERYTMGERVDLPEIKDAIEVCQSDGKVVAYACTETLAQKIIAMLEAELGPEDEADGKADDLCDQCMRSGVQVARTNGNGETICVDCDDYYVDDDEEEGGNLVIRYRCPVCYEQWEEDWSGVCDSECDHCGIPNIEALMWRYEEDPWTTEQEYEWLKGS